jgi:hypothetical protein
LTRWPRRGWTAQCRKICLGWIPPEPVNQALDSGFDHVRQVRQTVNLGSHQVGGQWLKMTFWLGKAISIGANLNVSGLLSQATQGLQLQQSDLILGAIDVTFDQNQVM